MFPLTQEKIEESFQFQWKMKDIEKGLETDWNGNWEDEIEMGNFLLTYSVFKWH